MRRLVVAFAVVLIALTLAGCGGGGDAAEAPATETPPPPPPVAAVDLANPIADRSAEESNTFEPFPSGSGVPTSVAERIADKQPMILVFTDDESRDSDDLLAEVKTVTKDNQGLADLLTYDVGEYSSMSKDGVAVVDEELSDDAKAQESIMLARKLGVTFTPFILIVDDQGMIIYRHSGFVDSDLIERQVLRVTE